MKQPSAEPAAFEAECGRRRDGRVELVGAVVLVAVCCLTFACTAVAAQKTFNGYVGGSSNVHTGGLFTQPIDAAVYTGSPGTADDKIFTVEQNGNNSSRVQRFDARWDFELAWGRDAVRPGAPGDTGTGFEICDVAADCKIVGPGSEAGEFDDPSGIAVNQSTGHLYVQDRDNRRVQEFDLHGGFVRAWGWDVAPEGAAGDTPTDEFEICTTICKAGTGGVGAGQFSASSAPAGTGIALHPVSGDVFASDPGSGSDGSRRVMQFDADGDFVRAWGFGVDDGAAQFQVCTTASGCQAAVSAGVENGRFANGTPRRIAVDANGVVYASDTADDGRVVRFDSDLAPATGDASGALLAPLSGSGILGGAAQTVGLEVDPATGNLFVARDPAAGATTVKEVSNPAAELAPAGPPNPEVVDTHTYVPEGSPLGLGFNPATGHLYILTQFQDSGSGVTNACVPVPPGACQGIGVLAIGTGPLVATLVPPLQPDDVTASSVDLSGEVTPSGGVARYRFQVSTDGSNWVDGTPDRYAVGVDPVPVAATVSGLDSATPYQARLLVRKQTATTVAEQATAVQFFTTDPAPPEVQTLTASKRRATSARLRGLVDPNGADTSYRFEWGVAGGALDQLTPPAPAGSGNSLDIVEQTLGGLDPDTEYDYRIVATNSEGADTGDVRSFKTLADDPTVNPETRGFELVSPADKVAGVGAGSWYAGPGSASPAGFAAHERERFAVTGTLGSVLVDGAFAYITDVALAERDADKGWMSKPAISRRAYDAQNVTDIGIQAAAPDLSLTTWGSNAHKLMIFPEMEGWEEAFPGEVLLLRDWTAGKWEVFGPTDTEQGGGLAQGKQAVAADGSLTAASGVGTRGLVGPSDPTHPDWPDLMGGGTVYLHQPQPSGLSDTFPGDGERSLANVCTDGTVLPARLSSGLLGDRECLSPTERNLVTIDATGGSFLLDVDGESTDTIAFDAPAESVQEALEGLSGLDPGDVAVGGGAGDDGGTKPYFVRWLDRPLGDAPELSADGSSLTGSTATATVETITVDSLISDNGAALEADVDEVVSHDGRRVFFLSPDRGAAPSSCNGTDATTSCPPQLYVRQQNSDEVVTRWISRAEVTQANGATTDQSASLMGEVRFEGASADGDKVFFRTNSPLTGDDPNGLGTVPPAGGVTTGSPGSHSWDLYMYDMPNGEDADPAGGDLVRISGGPDGGGDCNSPLDGGTDNGSLRWLSADGSRGYFTCAAPLPGVADPAGGTITEPGGTPDTGSMLNLYLFDLSRPSTDRWRFVARLPRTSPLGECATTAIQRGATITPPNLRTGELVIRGSNSCVSGSRDASFVSFFTDGRLTNDDPDSTSGDIYAYDAERDELTRVSNGQGGAGGSYPCAPASGAMECFGTPVMAVSGALRGLSVAIRPAGDRLVFFNSRSRLVAADVDGAYDVYQWRRTAGEEGELSLVTTGNSNTDGAFFLGTDRSGLNVYFSTRDRLTWQDRDSVLDVYTARVGGGIPQPPDHERCEVLDDDCQLKGAKPGPAQVESTSRGEGNGKSGVRRVISLHRPKAKALRKAARTGVVPVRVSMSAPGVVRLTVAVRRSGNVRRIAAVRKRLRRAGSTRVRLNVGKTAVQRLRSGRALRLSVTASSDGARRRSMRLVLRGADR